MLPSRSLEKSVRAPFTRLPLTDLSEVFFFFFLSPIIVRGKKTEGRCWLGSDQQHRRCQGRRKYVALIFNAPFPFPPNKLSATEDRADLFCQQWKYFKYDACHWVTQNPSHKKTYTAETSKTGVSFGLDLGLCASGCLAHSMEFE